MNGNDHLIISTELITKFSCEWDNYFNDGFDIFSINNGIDKRNLFPQFYQKVGSHEKIELNIENGLEFSFKEDHTSFKGESLMNTDEKIDMFGIIDIKESVELSPYKLEAELNRNIDKENEKEKENKSMDGQDNNRNEKIGLENKEKTDKQIINLGTNNNIINSSDGSLVHIPNLYHYNSESIIQDRDPVIIEENLNNKVSDLFLRDEEDEFELSNSNSCSGRNTLTNPDGKAETVTNTIPLVTGNNDNKNYDSNLNNNLDENESKKQESISGSINDIPASRLADTEILKNKEGEIKILIDKLDAYQFQNKLITDENKKLLEVINIFQVLHGIGKNESEPISSSNQILNNNQPLLLPNKEETSKVELNTENSSKIIPGESKGNDQKRVKSKSNIRPPIEKTQKGKTLISKKTFIQVGQIKTTSYGAIHKNKNGNKENLYTIQKTNNYETFEKNKETSKMKSCTSSARNNNNNNNNSPEKSTMQISTCQKEALLAKPNESLLNNYNTEVKSSGGMSLDDQSYILKSNCISPGVQYYSCEKKIENIEDISINKNKKNRLYLNEIEYLVDESKSGKSFENIEEFARNREVLAKNSLSNCQGSPTLEEMIMELHRCRMMNNQRISNLYSKSLSQKGSFNKNKKMGSVDVQNYLTIYKDQGNASANNYIIPFYLIEKRKLYENLVHYTFDKSQKPQVFPYYKSMKRSKSNPRNVKNKILP